jgi:CheY-like chemotaxis protein
MPGMNGVALVEQVRCRRPRMPVILATGYADQSELQKVVGLGERRLRNPYTQAALARAIAAVHRLATVPR